MAIRSFQVDHIRMQTGPHFNRYTNLYGTPQLCFVFLHGYDANLVLHREFWLEAITDSIWSGCCIVVPHAHNLVGVYDEATFTETEKTAYNDLPRPWEICWQLAPTCKFRGNPRNNSKFSSHGRTKWKQKVTCPTGAKKKTEFII